MSTDKEAATAEILRVFGNADPEWVALVVGFVLLDRKLGYSGDVAARALAYANTLLDEGIGVGLEDEEEDGEE